MSPSRRPRTMLWMLPTLVLLACLALLALLFFGQRGLLYFPAQTRVDPATTDFSLQRPDAMLRGWQVNPGRGPAILYFGGNGESIQYNRSMFGEHCPSSTTYLLAYRGYGASEGRPRSEALRADALALFDAVQQAHPGQPVAVVGRSLGSGIAAWVASRRPVARIVLVTPFDRMRDVAAHHYPWLPVRWLLREHYDSVDWLQGVDAPILVIRARHDTIVPAARTEALLQGLPSGTRDLVLPGDHNALGHGAEHVRAICDFLEPAAAPESEFEFEPTEPSP